MSEVPGSGPALGRGWILPAFILSLSVNLFAAGLVGGYWLRGGPPPPPPHGPDFTAPRMGPGKLLRALPESAREKARAVFEVRSGELFAARSRVRELRLETFTILSAEEFDPAALENAFARLREAEGEAAKAGQDALLEIAKQLTPEERAAAAKEVRERFKRRMERFGRGGRDGPPGYFHGPPPGDGRGP